MVAGGVFVQVGLLVASVAGLWLGARLLVDSVIRLARRLGLSELTVGLTVVAAGTSTPELVVSVAAAQAGLGDIAVGNVVGSNVYNLAFVLGVVSLVRAVPVGRSLVGRDGAVLVASTLVGAVVLVDLSVSRVEGAVLVALYVAYTAFLLRAGAGDADSGSVDAGSDTGDADSGSVDAGSDTGDADSGSADAGSDAGGPGTDTATAEPVSADAEAGSTALSGRVAFRGRDAAALVVGLAVVLGSGDLMVGAASTLARAAGLSDSVIGGTVVAAGTSTPEFAVSLVAMGRGRIGVSVGNVVGSNVFNLLAVLGVAAAVRPLAFAPVVRGSLAWLVVVTVLLVAALWTGRRLSRTEGALLTASELGRWALGLLGVVG